MATSTQGYQIYETDDAPLVLVESRPDGSVWDQDAVLKALEFACKFVADDIKRSAEPATTTAVT